jgi:hypothetical protein
MEHDVGFGAHPRGDIRQWAPYGKPGSLLVGNKAGSAGQREIALRLRQAIRHTMA